MTNIVKLDTKRQKIDNNGVYIYEKVDENMYTIVKILGEYTTKEDAIKTLQQIMSNEVSEDTLTKIIKENRQKMQE